MDKIIISAAKLRPVVIKEIAKNRDAVRWAYLGTDFLRMRQLEVVLGNGFERINIASIHETAADQIRKDYILWIDELNRLNGSDFEWWLSTISAKNIYNSNLFQYLCYIEIFGILMSVDSLKPSLIVVESKALAKFMLRWAKDRGLDTECVYPTYLTFLGSIKLCLKNVKGIAGAIFDSMCRILAAAISALKFGKKSPAGKFSIIISTFIHDNCITKEGVFSDRYYPYLHEYYGRKAIKYAVNPILFDLRFRYLSIYSRMRKSITPFIIAEDFLKPSDYLYAFTYPARRMFKKLSILPFRGSDMAEIVAEEGKAESKAPAIKALLMYRTIIRAGEKGLKSDAVLVWYENQVIDKTIVAASRIAFSGVKIMGARIFVYSPNLINLFPSQSEVDAGLTPDVLLEISDRQSLQSRAFTDAIPYNLVGALRHAYLFDEMKTQSEAHRNTKAVLVLLPFSILEAVELLSDLNSVLDKIPEDLPIFVKTHPDYSPEDIVKTFGIRIWPTRFQFFSGSMAEILSRAALAISSNSSSIVDAAIKGIPIIFVGRQTALNNNRMHGIKTPLMTECFSPDDLASAIGKYLNFASQEAGALTQEGLTIRNEFFLPVTDKTLAGFAAF